MTDEQKVTLEQPETAVPEAIQTAPEPVNPREAIEAALIVKNAEPYPLESDETEATPAPAKDKAEEKQTQEELSNPSEKVKAEMLKRINKVTARAKSAEERLAELEAENQRLREGRESKEEKVEAQSTEKREPTMEECRKALAKAASEGDWDFHAQITEYMADAKAKAQREQAEKSYREQTSKQTEAQKKQLTDWTNLCRDFEPTDGEGKVDIKHPLNLSNQQGLLYKTALDLFQDKELKAKYAGYDTITGFRLAVNDAYRGIMEQGLYKPARETAKVVGEERVMRRQVLAEPDSDGDDSAPSQTNAIMSDADKVREEIKERQRNRYKRPLASR